EVPRVCDDELVRDAETPAEVVALRARMKVFRVDEVRDHAELAQRHALASQVLEHPRGDHGDCGGTPVYPPLERSQCPDHWPARQGSEIDGDVGVDLLDVVDERTSAQEANEPGADTDCQGWRRA